MVSYNDMCPVCTVAVCAGLGLSRWLKIDDTVSGLWIGGLIISLSLVLAKPTQKFLPLSQKILTLLYILVLFFTTIFPLKYLKVIGDPTNMFCGLDKLVFGVTTGMAVFSFSLLVHLYLKKKHGQKSYFPFQKVIIPILVLIIASIILYLIVK